MALDIAKIDKLIAVLDKNEKAKTIKKEGDNPLGNHSLKDLSHGVRKGADNIPARNMAAVAPDSDAAMSMEAARFAVADVGREDKSAKRMAQARARAARKVEFDAIADSPIVPAPERMQQAWLVVFHLVPIITKIGKSKQRWANRLLGSNADDIGQMALEKTALVLAKQTKFDLEVLRVAAEQLGNSERGIPGNQEVNDDDPKEVKQIRKARKWLMGVCNNRVQGALVDSYTAVHNLRWDNLDLIATVLASINGPGDDPMFARFKADRAPAFLGTRFRRPGGVDPNVLAVAVSAAITDRGLDPLTEFILDDEHRRVDGAVKWSEHARDVFLLTPEGLGPWAWDQVEKATEHLRAKRKARGDAARRHARNLFAFLPGVILGAVDAFDPRMLGWSSVGRRAVMASGLDFYLPGGDELGERRFPLEPALRFDSTAEAAQALVEHLAVLRTGQDLVESVVYA